ncbi:hypothetical protein ACIQBJ_28860 [Kitasatospora sp. NPDC088391]|uniref:hypothetical protein n=1 Tax=Kitasatospora sp. NPDC088391 TaxID=3364074 RepID=UPI00380D854E
MGYYLEAVVAAEPLLRAAAAGLPSTRVVPVARGLALLPMSDALDEAIRTDDAPLAPFRMLPNGFDRTLAAWSEHGPVAYVEADIWGGTGEQAVAVWTRGALTLGPLVEATGSPISLALRRLGATPDGHVDEFDAVGLGRHRRTESWLTQDG